MATRHAVPASVLALPFLLARRGEADLDWSVRAALSAAIAAERAVDSGRRNTRSRLAWLLCELGFQLGRRNIGRDQDLPVPRIQLAEALGTSLCRVKRTLALLGLSGIIAADARTIRVLDWRKLTSLAGYDPARLELGLEEEPLAPPPLLPPQAFTASGDPACFV